MALTILRRLAAAVITLLVVIVTVFLLQQLVPGDPAIAIAGEDATPEVIAQIREQLNLNRSLPVQLVEYVWHAMTFQLGTSLQSQQPVTQLLRDALPVTVSLALVSLLFTLVVGIAAGTLAAMKPGSWIDRLLVGSSAVALAIPPFVTGLLLQRVFGVRLGWLPAIGYTPITEDPVLWFKGLILPGLTLAAISAAEVARQLRGNLIDTREQDYIRTLRAKGLPVSLVLFKHAYRNAAAPMLTVLGIQFGSIIGGAVIIEQVFALPGLGQTGVNAILSQDFPVVQGVVLFGATMVILLNLAVDLINTKLNPRVAHQ
ncbi:ABC transporter permease [Nocardioides sp.]|uniref:ABC transporter permease n=1 Tax=Nocardioides sp. TaxID=35761 RepID=UPI003D0B4F12